MKLLFAIVGFLGLAVLVAYAQQPAWPCPIVPCGRANAEYKCTSDAFPGRTQTLVFKYDARQNRVEFYDYPFEDGPRDIYPIADDDGDDDDDDFCRTEGNWDQYDSDLLSMSNFIGCGSEPAPTPTNEVTRDDDDDDDGFDDDFGNPPFCSQPTCPLLGDAPRNFFRVAWDDLLECKVFNLTVYDDDGVNPFTFNYGPSWRCTEHDFVDDDDEDSQESCKVVPCLEVQEPYICTSPSRPGSRFRLRFFYEEGERFVNFNLLRRDGPNEIVGCKTRGTWEELSGGHLRIGSFQNCGIDDDEGSTDIGTCNLASCPLIQYPPDTSSVLELFWNEDDCGSFIGEWQRTFDGITYLSDFKYGPLLCRKEVDTTSNDTPTGDEDK